MQQRVELRDLAPQRLEGRQFREQLHRARRRRCHGVRQRVTAAQVVAQCELFGREQRLVDRCARAAAIEILLDHLCDAIRCRNRQPLDAEPRECGVQLPGDTNRIGEQLLVRNEHSLQAFRIAQQRAVVVLPQGERHQQRLFVARQQ